MKMHPEIQHLQDFLNIRALAFYNEKVYFSPNFLIRKSMTFSKMKEALCEKSPNTRKYRPKKTPYLDTFLAVQVICHLSKISEEVDDDEDRSN